MRICKDMQIRVMTDSQYPGHGIVQLGDSYVPVRITDDDTVITTWSHGGSRIHAERSEESAWQYIASRVAEY